MESRDNWLFNSHLRARSLLSIIWAGNNLKKDQFSFLNSNNRPPAPPHSRIRLGPAAVRNLIPCQHPFIYNIFGIFGGEKPCFHAALSFKTHLLFTGSAPCQREHCNWYMFPSTNHDASERSSKLYQSFYIDLSPPWTAHILYLSVVLILFLGLISV